MPLKERALSKKIINLRGKILNFSFNKLSTLNKSKKTIKNSNTSLSNILYRDKSSNTVNEGFKNQYSNNTSIVNLFSNSFDSNNSSYSNKSVKLNSFNESKMMTDTQKEEDILDKIQIKETNESNAPCSSTNKELMCNSNKSKEIEKSQLKREPIKKKNNKILINISTIYNKNLGNGYHKRRNENTNYSHIKTEVSEDSKTDFSNLDLKKKISELLELNSKLLNEKTELENRNNGLKKNVAKLKKYIIDNKIQDIKQLKGELTQYKNELILSKNAIILLKNENEKLKKENKNLVAISNNLKKNEKLTINSIECDEDTENKNNENKFQRLSNKFTTFKKQQTFSIDPDSI